MMLLAVVSNRAVSNPLAEYSAPMPKFATQPSATVIYCKGVLNNTLQGFNDDKKALPNVTGKIENYANARLRLSFNSAEVMVATTTHFDGKQNLYVDFPYKIVDDDPVHFFAMQKRTKDDILQMIALDRVTGTLIWTTLSASFPNIPAHPYASSTFYVCSQTDD